MSSLPDLQRSVLLAITRGQGSGVSRRIVGERVPAHVRLQVYVNNWRETARKTLAASYPVVQALVGPDCFRSLSRLYARRFPSRSGDLAGFGAQFPILLRDFYRDTAFAYLAGVAELEWACVESAEAPDAAPIDASALHRVTESDVTELSFLVHPSVRLVSAPYCVFTIWHAHQQENLPVVDFDAPGENVLVYRSAGERVRLQAVDRPTFAFIGGLTASGSVVQAQHCASSLAADFDPAGALQDLFCAGLLVGFSHPIHGDHFDASKESD